MTTGTEKVILWVETLSWITLPIGHEFPQGVTLKRELPIEVRVRKNAAHRYEGVLATTAHPVEYGWGETQEEALADLKSSLVELWQVLEARQYNLGGNALADFLDLRRLFRDTASA